MSELRIERVIAAATEPRIWLPASCPSISLTCAQVVDVDDHQRVGTPEALGLAMLLLQHFFERTQIQQAGERIGRRQIADALHGAVHLLDQRREDQCDGRARRQHAEQLHAEFAAARYRRPA